MFDYFLAKGSEIVDIYKKDLTDFAVQITDQTGALLKTDSEPEASKLEKLQENVATYQTPCENEEDYKEWIKTFNLESKTEEITSLLQNYPLLVKTHTELISETLTYQVFWTRYFYQYYQLLKLETKKDEVRLESWDDVEKSSDLEKIVKDQTAKIEKLEKELKLFYEMDSNKILEGKEERIRVLEEENSKLKKQIHESSKKPEGEKEDSLDWE